jgi:hypothetical protein
MVVWATMFCIVALLRRYWTEHEHLSFPQVAVPLYVAGAGHGRRLSSRGFWTEPLMWIGFGVAMAHFLTIMLHGLNPTIPTLGISADLGALLTERPLDSLRPLMFCHNPMLTGFAYFAPQDLSFSMWFFYIFWDEPIKLFYAVSGLEAQGAPYTAQQGAGVFFAIALLAGWAGRGYWRGLWQAAWRGRPVAGPGERHPWADPLSTRLALVGLGCGFAALCAWYVIAGMSWWVAVPFLMMVLLFATVFTRGRAETGVYSVFLIPYFQAGDQLKSFLGSGVLAPYGNHANFTLLASALSLNYGFFAENMTFQIEGLRLAEECRIKTSHMTVLIMVAALVGLVIRFWSELDFTREYGSFGPVGPSSEGGWWPGEVRASYAEVSQLVDGVKLSPDWHRNGFTIGAFLIALLLGRLRAAYPRSPLNPLGMALGIHYGVVFWGPFLTAWAAKGVILRLGGGRLYHRLIPFFIGLIVGQLFAQGVVWNVFGMFAPESWRGAAVLVQG